MTRQLIVSSVLVLLALVFIADAARITNLPGWKPEKPFGMYSGYIDLPGGKKYFYWYVSTETRFST